MSPYTFIADLNGMQADLERINPDILRALGELMDIVEQQDAQIRVLLDVNKKLLAKK